MFNLVVLVQMFFTCPKQNVLEIITIISYNLKTYLSDRANINVSSESWNYL